MNLRMWIDDCRERSNMKSGNRMYRREREQQSRANRGKKNGGKGRTGLLNSGTVAFAAVLGATLLSISGAETTLASSPSFARTAEEWETLQDNRLDYAEIEGLIQEYNPTVQQNQYSYRKFRKDYGDTKDDVAGEYRRLANELLSDIVYPDEDSGSYASGMMAALSSEMQANSLLKQADENLEDAEIIRLNYEMAEKALVQTAQNNLITWHTGQLTIQTDALAKRQAEIELSIAEAQAGAGTGTQIQVLTAKQNVQNAEKTLLSDSSAADTARQKLQIMLGWKADSQPEIGEIPSVDMARIDAMKPAEDIVKALENNYTLRVNRKKLQNAVQETDISTLRSTIADNEGRIAAGLNSAYQNVLTAKKNYLYSQSNAALAAQTAAQTAQRYALGTVSRTASEIADISAKQAELSLKREELALFQAMETYDWAVRGMTSASASS